MLAQLEQVRGLLTAADLEVPRLDLDDLARAHQLCSDLAADLAALRATIDAEIAATVDRSMPIWDSTHEIIVSRSASASERWDHAAVARDVIRAVGGDIDELVACLPASTKWSAPRIRGLGLNPDLYRERETRSRIAVRIEPLRGAPSTWGEDE
jgi:hypothetical protein